MAMLPAYVVLVQPRSWIMLTWHNPRCGACEGCGERPGWSANVDSGWVYLSGLGFELSLRVGR